METKESLSDKATKKLLGDKKVKNGNK